MLSGPSAPTWAHELEAEYDRSLRQERIAAYQALWKDLQPLAKYAPPGPVTYRTVHDLSVGLRSWYFETGGIYLSEAASNAYFDLMDTCQEVMDGMTGETSEDLQLDGTMLGTL